jgi:hypothetical protein
VSVIDLHLKDGDGGGAGREAAGRMYMKHHRNDGLSAFQSAPRSIGSLDRMKLLKTEKLEQVPVGML